MLICLGAACLGQGALAGACAFVLLPACVLVSVFEQVHTTHSATHKQHTHTHARTHARTHSLSQALAGMLLEVCKNPRAPGFNHYLFESVAALIRCVCLSVCVFAGGGGG